MSRELRIVHAETGEVIRRMDVTDRGDRHVERAISGLLRQMSDDYYVEDSADDEAPS